MLNNVSRPFQAFLQATGVVLYLILLSIFFNFVTPYFKNDSAEFFAPIIMLLLFIISAVTTSLLVLGRAGMLFWDKKYKDAFSLVWLTVGWLALYFLLTITTLYAY